MAITRIDTFLESLPEQWMRDTFIERLDNSRLLIDEETFGDSTAATDVLTRFLQLESDARNTEILRIRMLNTVCRWAKTASEEDINSIISALRREKDSRLEPEDPGDGEGGEGGDGNDGETTQP